MDLIKIVVDETESMNLAHVGWWEGRGQQELSSNGKVYLISLNNSHLAYMSVVVEERNKLWDY